MSLRIRQIVLAARDLDATVAQIERALGLEVVYRDPLVAEFGLHNALFAIGDQFLEVISPLQPNTAAGRHLNRHGDSAYMLILQTDDLDIERARLVRLGVRMIWQADYPDMRAAHLHPKDIGAAIVSLDQPTPPESWRWAGTAWQPSAAALGAPSAILEATIGARNPEAMALRWAEVLGTPAPADGRIAIASSVLRFERAGVDRITGFRLSTGTAGHREPLSICNTELRFT